MENQITNKLNNTDYWKFNTMVQKKIIEQNSTE
jgi:hypothetical protein